MPKKKKKKKITKRAQRALDALLGKKECPYCKADLKEEGIRWSEEGETTYRMLVEANELEYHDPEFFSRSGKEYFFCLACGKELSLSEEEVLRILK